MHVALADLASGEHWRAMTPRQEPLAPATTPHARSIAPVVGPSAAAASAAADARRRHRLADPGPTRCLALRRQRAARLSYADLPHPGRTPPGREGGRRLQRIGRRSGLLQAMPRRPAASGLLHRRRAIGHSRVWGAVPPTCPVPPAE